MQACAWICIHVETQASACLLSSLHVPDTSPTTAVWLFLQEAWRLNPTSLEEFVDLWAQYDDGTGTIDPRDLEAMLLR